MPKIRQYIRYAIDGVNAYGMLEGDKVAELDGNFLDNAVPTGRSHPLSEVRLLAPVEPRKVFAVGLNYESHLGDRTAPEVPGIFLKLPTSVIGTGEPIVIPKHAEVIQCEAEMVLVIGKGGKHITRESALGHVFGVTCGNDVSARKWQRGDLQWFRGKAPDTFAPIGPAIATGLNYEDLLLQGRVNGETQQEQRTSDLIHKCADIIQFISATTTLEPGDLIFTGTPGSTKTIVPGDTVEVQLEGTGTLTNPVIAQD